VQELLKIQRASLLELLEAYDEAERKNEPLLRWQIALQERMETIDAAVRDPERVIRPHKDIQ